MDTLEMAGYLMDDLNWATVTSTNITRVAYMREHRVLLVEFWGGRVYAYEGVGIKAYVGLMTAASLGSYFSGYIRDHYPYARLR